jgi:hypothetical protein
MLGRQNLSLSKGLGKKISTPVKSRVYLLRPMVDLRSTTQYPLSGKYP